MLAGAALTSVIGQMVLFRAISKIGVLSTSIAIKLEPIVTLSLAALLNGEILTFR
jgi:drug/metabolite transporter (DMT)-like permease